MTIRLKKPGCRFAASMPIMALIEWPMSVQGFDVVPPTIASKSSQ